MYEELILPREIRLVEAIRAMGAFVRLHICGDIQHLLPGIARLAPDLVDVDWQVDMGMAREILGRNIALCGNLDPVAGVQNGEPDGIRSGLLDIYGSVGNPYMVGAGCEIPVDTPAGNLAALCRPIAYVP